MPGKLKNLLFILILGSVSAGMLLGIRSYTMPIIKRYQEMVLKDTVLKAANIPHTKENLDQIFAKEIKEKQANGLEYYLSPDNRYIFEFKGRGLWGMIEGVLTLDPDLKTINSLQIISQEETPGLGGRIGEQKYLDQFKNKKADPKLVLVSRKKASKVDEIDAITGATISSQALVKSINDSIEEFRSSVKR